MSTQPTSAIERAVALADGVEKLAEACGVSAQAVYKWIKKGHPPTDRCEAIERAVEGRISRFELLPPSFANSADAIVVASNVDTSSSKATSAGQGVA